MKSPYESRLFCSIISLACAWFLFVDFRDNQKINFLNLIMFICTTYLALHKKKKSIEELKTEIKPVEKKEISIDEDKDLQLTQIFKKELLNKK